ncbi:hypothetical protein KP509_04G108400 [Ceratopteris richardii]|uniref:X8 domain-containing protein n=1 Tax=Ceratopteris richardii TaxID=49495 RepID=A0A8T2UWB9_CERRI|nr:hypothetical protein KP509_04G108400 [Ceratopteris richardii]
MGIYWKSLIQTVVLSAFTLLAGGVRRTASQAVFCVARHGADVQKLQEALDWACGKGNNMGSVDCSAIQSGGACYEPNTVADHASYAFTLYYTLHRDAASQACDFHGLATLTPQNPSSGNCVYPTSQDSVGNVSPSPPDASSMVSPLQFPPQISDSPAPSPNSASSTAVSFLIVFISKVASFVLVSLHLS